VTTYLFIGLILLLAAYLVRARRTKGDGSPSLIAPRERAPRAPVASPTPMPAAMAVAESAAAHAAPPRADAPPPARPAPAADPALDWTPGETIVEPGWPLPGEISGGWSTAPSSPPATFTEPAPVVEWQPVDPSPAPGDAPGEAELPGAEEWAMPALDASGGGADTGASGPPLWTPEGPLADTDAPIDASAIWLDEPAAASAPADAGAVGWQPEIAEVPDAPPLEWSSPDAAAETPDTSELAWAAGPSIAPEPEAPVSVWESSATPSEPGAATPEPEAATGPSDEETGTTAPAAVPEWIAAAAPEHAAFAASVFGEPAPAEPSVTGLEIPEIPEETPDVPAIATWTDAPAIVAYEPAPETSPEAAPLTGLVPLTSVCDHLGVTPRMLALMRILADTPMSVSELARSLAVSRPLVADLCTRLQAADLAEREPDDADRRRVRVVLTEAGHLLCAETAVSPETGSYERVLAGLSPAERAQLRIALREMDGTPA
jgi:DNA-binding MarR family transcriptional regulator